MSSANSSTVGEILDQRYVVVAEVGPDGPAFRYVVYDTERLSQAHARVWPDGDTEIVNPSVPLIPPPPPLPEPPPPPSKRAKAEIIEAAWFAQGESLESSPDPSMPDGLADHLALEQLAAELPDETLSQYALRTTGDRRGPSGIVRGGMDLTEPPYDASRQRVDLHRLAARTKPWILSVGGGAAVGLITALLAVAFASEPSGHHRAPRAVSPTQAAAGSAAPTASARLTATTSESSSQFANTTKKRSNRAGPNARLSRRSWIRIRRNLRRAHHAYRRDRYQLARVLALRVLRIDPRNRRAAGLKRRAEAKLGL